MNKIVVLLACFTAFISCKKKDYPPDTVENAPVFWLRATVNGQPVSFSAGVDGYQMYSECPRDTDNVYTFTGILRKSECGQSCPNSMRIAIKDSHPAAGASGIGSITPRTYEIFGPSYGMAFDASFNKAASSYKWDFGDGTGSALASPTHVFAKPGTYNVCVTVSDASGCYSSMCKTVQVGAPADVFNVNVTAGISGTAATFTSSIQGGSPPYGYRWIFGDGTEAASATPSHTYKVRGSYPVTLIVTDASGREARCSYNLVTQGDVSSCAANMLTGNSYEIAGGVSPLNKIFLSWTDASGKEYTSAAGSQSPTSFFQIVSVADYEANENGQRTKQLHVKFTADLFNSGSRVTISDADAVITVAYQ